MAWDPLTPEQRSSATWCGRSRASGSPRAPRRSTRSHEFPWDVVEAFRETGVFGLFFSEEDGGTGTGTLLSLVAIEEVSRVCATSGLILAVQELGSLGLKLAGSAEQRAAWLPRLASGEVLAAYALTEAGSGSDSAAMRTTARRDGDEWVLDGTKRFITNAGVAGVYTVFAKTDPDAGHDGISAFIVEADTPGFEVARLEEKLGIARLDDRRARLRRLPRARQTRCSARRARGSGSRCGSSTARAPASPRRRSESRRARPTTRSSTHARARRWGGRSRSTS